MNARNLNYILIAAIVIMIILFATCKFKKYVAPSVPVVQPVAEQILKVVRDSIYTKHVIDSITETEVVPAETKAAYWEGQFHTERKNAIMQGDFLTDVINKQCPDTTGKIKKLLSDYVTTNNKVASDCDSTTKSKNRIITGKDGIIRAKDNLIAKNKASLDTAFKIQNKLHSYIDSLQPKRSILLGITGSTSNGFNGFGPAIGYLDKKGNQFDYSLQFLNGFKVKQHTVTVKKVLFRL